MKQSARIYAIRLICSILCLTSCKEKPTPPILTTANVSDITTSTAWSGGKVTGDGGAEVTSRGVCWYTSENPTESNSKSSGGSGTGSFTANLTQLIPDTKYYVRAYAANSEGTGYGNEVSFTTLQINAATLITVIIAYRSNAADIKGIITSNGGAAVTASGVCWSETQNPVVTDHHTDDGTTSGEFLSSITGLTANTTYYVKAYATTSFGTAYGNEESFTTPSVFEGSITDIEGNIYNLVALGTQTWMKENLKTTRYRNGDLIGTTTPATLDISGESTPKYQWAYAGNESNVITYGRLYTWHAVADSRNVCPAGWHVPTDVEWTILTDYLINNGYAYGGSGDLIAKSMAATSGWTTYTTAGTVGNDQASNNSSDFSALPGGSRSNNGVFVDVGDNALWWSSTETLATYAFYRYIIYVNSVILSNYCDKATGLSVRCIKDI